MKYFIANFSKKRLDHDVVMSTVERPSLPSHKVDNHLAMLFRNYSNRHLSCGHLSRKKQRWDASTNYDSISTDEDDDKEEDTADCGGTSIQWNRRRLPNQWRRRSTLEDHSDEESSSDTGVLAY